MATPVRIGMIDHSAEQTSTTLYFPTPVNDDYSGLLAPTTGAYDIVKAAFIALTALNLTRSTATIEVDASVGEVPELEHAQRELRLRIVYVDNVTGKKYRMDVPGPASGVIPKGTDEVPISNPLLTAFKTVFEAQCVSPVGNPVTLQRAYVTGRYA